MGYPRRVVIAGRWVALVAGLLLAVMARAAEPTTTAFDIPAGDAEVTLRQFVDQSGEEVIYWTDRVRGIPTNAVSGRMTAHEALEKMLAETPLGLMKDRTSGALAINPRALAAGRDGVARSDRAVVKLSPFEVAGNVYNGYLASRTFSGGKTVMSLTDVPQTLQVVTRDLIDDTGAVDPNEVLSRVVPGVSGFAGPSGVNATIRGFRAQNWSVDGATTRYIGMITNFNYEAFEVIKGPASVTFGPFAAYGGYINMVPKNARRHAVNKVELAAGTTDFYSSMLDVGGESAGSGRLQYRFVAGTVDAGRPGWNWDFNRVLLVAPSVAYDFSDDTRLTLRLEFSDVHQKLSSTALDRNGQLVEDFSSNGPEIPGMDRVNRDANRLVQSVLTSRLSDEWSMRLNLMAGLGEKDFNHLNLNGQTAATDYLMSPFQAHYEWMTLFADYSLSWKIEDVAASGISNHLVAGASIDHWDINYVIYDGTMIAPVNTWRVDPTAPNWNALNYRFAYPTRFIDYNTEWLSALVAEDRVGFFHDKLQLSAAVRQNRDNRSSYTRWRTPQTQDAGGIYTGTPVSPIINERPTYRYGLVYKPVENIALYAGYTEAYLAIGAIYKVDGSRLAPETGSNREVGVKLDAIPALGGTITGNLALFQVEVHNKWRTDPVNAGFFIQDGEQINRGIEAQLTYASDRFSGLIGAYLADGPTEQNTDLRAVMVPNRTFNAWLKYSLTPRLALGGGYRHVSDTISNNRLYRTEPFGIADLFATYTHPFRGGRLIWRLGITNVADDPAVYRMDSAAAVNREDGRRIKLTTTYTW